MNDLWETLEESIQRMTSVAVYAQASRTLEDLIIAIDTERRIYEYQGWSWPPKEVPHGAVSEETGDR